MTRLTRYLFGSTLSVLACIAGGASKVTAQESTPYLSSPLIEASPLPEEKMRSLAEFF